MQSATMCPPLKRHPNDVSHAADSGPRWYAGWVLFKDILAEARHQENMNLPTKFIGHVLVGTDDRSDELTVARDKKGRAETNLVITLLEVS